MNFLLLTKLSLLSNLQLIRTRCLDPRLPFYPLKYFFTLDWGTFPL